ncbi:MAG TPA: hypothetical protein VNV41_04180 [Candidatus Acidoferrales bacterium]|nr:hypothetical protein [Candidatus Acidoferrales bacterium]
MKQPGQGIFKRFGFYIGAALLAAAVWQVERYMQSGATIYQAIPIQQEVVSAFLEMNRLLTTLATTLLGAMGLLLFGGFRGKSCSRELWAAIAGTVCVGLSIYYGYVAYLAVISMLETGSFDPYSPQLLRDQHAHFYTFLVGVVLFAGFIYQNMTTEDEHEHHEHSHNATGC